MVASMEPRRRAGYSGEMTRDGHDDPGENLLRGAGRLGEEYAWPLQDCAAVVERLTRTGRAVGGGELWILLRDGPLYGIPRISRNAPIYGAAPFIDPTTGEFKETGLYTWGIDRSEDEAWDEYCRRAAEVALGHPQRIDELRRKMVPEVRDKVWVALGFITPDQDAAEIEEMN